jgi:carbonic anhydrase
MTTNDILLAAALTLDNLECSTSFIDTCCTNNIEFARTYDEHIYHHRAIPSKHLAIICCMDARLDLYRILGLQPGQAHIIRNGK